MSSRTRALAVLLGLSFSGCRWQGMYDEQTYLPARHNWAFRKEFSTADRLFNAFDYGHSIIYEELYARPDGPVAEVEDARYAFITDTLLRHPPALPLEESAIAPDFIKLVPEVHEMFAWTHMLHRQIYDVWADDRIAPTEKDARVAALLRFYRGRSDLAFSARPKSMALMEGQPYSRAFRARYPKFNGLLWSYHWMQMALYDALLTATTDRERARAVDATVAHFRQLLDDAPRRMPTVMPMSAAIAPIFAERYADAAIIFDNMHSLHDVVADILRSPVVPHNQKRAAILLAAARYRDDSSFVTTVAEWRAMAVEMGAEHMGGVQRAPDRR